MRKAAEKIKTKTMHRAGVQRRREDQNQNNASRRGAETQRRSKPKQCTAQGRRDAEKNKDRMWAHYRARNRSNLWVERCLVLTGDAGNMHGFLCASAPLRENTGFGFLGFFNGHIEPTKSYLSSKLDVEIWIIAGYRLVLDSSAFLNLPVTKFTISPIIR